MSYPVGRLAELAGVTVRTLHHYDRIGLLPPSDRSHAGYRHYDSRDLERLRQILYYRELGFGLDQIAKLVDQPGVDADSHLRNQHRLLRQRVDRLTAMLGAIEHEMEARQMGVSLTPEEQFEIFGENWLGEDFEAETQERWGDTEAYAQSQRRTATYTKDDWVAIKAESDANLRDFAAAMASGVPAESTDAMDLAEAHRQHLSRWFYDCGYEIHRGLAQMYLADERFRRNYDQVATGLAEYVHDAIQANAVRQTPRPGRS